MIWNIRMFLMCSMRGSAGQIVGQGFSGKKTQLGVKMSKTVKKVGSLNLKTMIEEDKLLLNDYETISRTDYIYLKNTTLLKQKRVVMMTWQCVWSSMLG